MTFVFMNNAYESEIEYGVNRAYITVFINPTKYGYEREEIVVYVPNLIKKPFSVINYYKMEDTIMKLYFKWEDVLCEKLSDHLMKQVDIILESIEIKIYQNRKRKWLDTK